MTAEHDKVEAILAGLSRRAAALGLESLAEHERTALLAYTAHGVIARGGFKEFYEGSFPLTSLVEALRKLKLSALANAAEATATAFPEPRLADDASARQSHLSSIATERQDYVFFRLSSDELLSSIVRYWKGAAGAKRPHA